MRDNLRQQIEFVTIIQVKPYVTKQRLPIT